MGVKRRAGPSHYQCVHLKALVYPSDCLFKSVDVGFVSRGWWGSKPTLYSVFFLQLKGFFFTIFYNSCFRMQRVTFSITSLINLRTKGSFMKSLILFLSLSLASTVSLAFEGTFFDTSSVPQQVNSVHMEVFDMSQTGLGCSYPTCFRMEVYLNDVLVARWATSPGDPNNNAGFKGVNTPKYTDRNLNRGRIMGAGYVSGRGDAMPYAMFILGSQGQNTGFAVHAGHVTGEKESHGCIRLEYENAKILNSWVRAAIKNGGPTTISTSHTTN